MAKSNKKPLLNLDDMKKTIRRMRKSARGMKAHIEELCRLTALEVEHLPDLEPAVVEYTVVKLVALLQSAFRNVFREVVNWRDLEEKPLPDFSIQFSMSVVQEIKKKNFTLGDVIALSFPLNSYKEMIDAFEQVTGEKFGNVLKNMPESNFFEEDQNNMCDVVYKNMDALFRHRNIICHEISQEEMLTVNKLAEWIYVVIPVIEALGFYESTVIPHQVEYRN